MPARSTPSGKELTHAEVLRRIAREVELHGSHARAAAAWRVSRQYVTQVLAGEDPIGPKLLRALHLKAKRQIIYTETARA